MEETKEYKVLARKYRPKKFSDLVGQDSLVQILSNAITNDRLAHAYILTGVRGVGKTTTARLIAMSINCQTRQKKIYEPCGDCDSCKSTGIDNNLDVIEMDAASNTGVDDVREIIDNVRYKPVTAKYKIFIIDEVHMLSKSAFNALLKTLEEPPEHVKFIFATTEIKKIPLTVLSRCQRFDLLRIENKILSEHLINVANKEKIEIESDAVSIIVKAADGSIRDGLSLLDQAITIKNSTIKSKDVINMLGLAEREKIYDLLEKILEGNSPDSLNLYKNIYDLGADVIMIFDELINIVHFLTQLKIFPDLKNDNFIPELERTRGLDLSSRLSLNNLNIIWQILFRGFQELQTGFHIYQHGEMIILRIIYLMDISNPDDLLKKTNNEQSILNLENNNQQKSKQENNKNKILNFSDTTEVKKNKNYQEIQDFRQFVELFFTNREGILHTQLYNEVSLVSFKVGEIVINIDKISNKTFTRDVAKLISKWTGRIWQVKSSTSNLGKSLHDEDIIIQQKEIELMKNNSQVKKILDEFPDSKIHSISELTDIDKNEEISNSKMTKEK